MQLTRLGSVHARGHTGLGHTRQVRAGRKSTYAGTRAALHACSTRMGIVGSVSVWDLTGPRTCLKSGASRPHLACQDALRCYTPRLGSVRPPAQPTSSWSSPPAGTGVMRWDGTGCPYHHDKKLCACAERGMCQRLCEGRGAYISMRRARGPSCCWRRQAICSRQGPLSKGSPLTPCPSMCMWWWGGGSLHAPYHFMHAVLLATLSPLTHVLDITGSPEQSSSAWLVTQPPLARPPARPFIASVCLPASLSIDECSRLLLHASVQSHARSQVGSGQAKPQI